MFAVIKKSRRKQKVGTGGKATQPEERLELSGSKIAEEFYTDPDLTNDSKELIDVLKDKALTLKKPSDFGPSHDKKLKKVQKKYRKGEISKDTYESIKEIMGKRDQT